jgi:SAM-dependent methyltransferase
MKLDSQDLQKIFEVTVGHYDKNAQNYWEGTRDHDVSQNIAAFLRYLDHPAGAAILDFGCGPGRDLISFTKLGHRAIGLDGSAEFAVMARKNSGCEVWQQDFLNLNLPESHFDGVFANATLFHVPSQELPRVLKDLHACLKPQGILFTSNPRGDNQEGWRSDRYGAFHDLESWRKYVTATGFAELSHYYRPEGLPREQQPWLASVWRRLDTPAAG